MPIQITEPVKASMVITDVGYLAQPAINVAFGLDQKTTGNVLILQSSETEHHFKAHRDRITIYQQPNRVIVEKESPSGLDDLDQLADVAEMAISNIDIHVSNLPPTTETPLEERRYTFGFNLEAMCSYQTEQNQTVSVTIDRYLDMQRFKDQGISRFSGNLTVEFPVDEHAWRLTLGPFAELHEGSLLFVNANRHSANQILPRTKQAISEELHSVWSTTEYLINMLEVPK